MQETQIGSLGLEDPLERKWQPTPVFLPGKSHGQRILVGYSQGGWATVKGAGRQSKTVRYDLATKTKQQ